MEAPPDDLPSDARDLANSYLNLECVTEFGAILEKEKPPPLIYHYTNGDGLRGILESGCLRFTSIFNLNDPSELHHGVSHACRIIDDASAAVNAPAELKLFARGFTEALRGNIETTARYLVCCFSRQGDELGQWRAYADDGRGFVLGFDATILEQAFSKAAPGNHSTFPVTYDDAKLRQLQDGIVTATLPYISAPSKRGWGTDVVARYEGEIRGTLAAHILHSATFFKHAAYKNEDEYRFLQLHNPRRPVEGIKLRSRPYELIRYREFDWRAPAAAALKQIAIGPAADARMAFRFVDDCIREFFPAEHSVNIRKSEIPYRSR